MPLPLHAVRRFRYGRYFGDGSYPSTPKYFVLTDRITKQLYRVTVSNSVVTLVAIAGITSYDIKEDFMVVRDFRLEGDRGIVPRWLNLYPSNGVLLSESTHDNTRPALVSDGTFLFEIIFDGTGPDVFLTGEGFYDDATSVYNEVIYG